MARKKARRGSDPKTPKPKDDAVTAYKRIRKPMPPPERVIPDRRREQAERLAEREAADDAP